MRHPEIITQDIQSLDKIIFNSNELLLQFPNDNILRLNVEQAESKKNILLLELEKSCEFHGQHSIKYIFQNIQQKIKLDTLIDGLKSFKGLIDMTYETVTNGKHNILPIYFNTVFNGSYGVQLTTPFEEKLFDHDYEKSLSQTMTLVNDLISANDDMILTTLQKDFEDNELLLQKYSKFFNKIHQSNEPIRIEWKSPISKKIRKVVIEPKKAKLLYKFFSQKNEKEDSYILVGIIMGISLLKYQVEFVKENDTNPIVAKFDKKLSEDVKKYIDVKVTAKFKVSIKINDINDKEIKKYDLVSISPY